MCFGIRISSPLHLATQITPIHNIDCTKNAKNACGDMILGMIFHECGMLFHKCVILFHECGMHYTPISNVCHFHKNVNSEQPVIFWEFKATGAWNRDSVCTANFANFGAQAQALITSKCWDKDHVHAFVFALLRQFRF